MKNIKKYIIYSLSIFVIVLFFINLQSFVVKVKASADSVSVSPLDLGFGLVFPGETIEKNFTVSLTTSTEGAKYQITQNPKTGYLDLCPFLEITNEEGEGDTTTSATLNATSTPPDTSDTWKIIFSVPAILGFIAQDHIYGVVSSGGDYCCDVLITVLTE